MVIQEKVKDKIKRNGRRYERTKRAIQNGFCIAVRESLRYVILYKSLDLEKIVKKKRLPSFTKAKHRHA